MKLWEYHVVQLKLYRPLFFSHCVHILLYWVSHHYTLDDILKLIQLVIYKQWICFQLRILDCGQLICHLNQALVLCYMIMYCITDYKFALWFVSLVHAKTLLCIVMWQIILMEKMLFLFWPVIIVLTLSVADVVSESQVGTSGLTERTIVPSSTTECSASCLTWSQCVADPSQCFCITSHTNVTMLPGEYILHEFVALFDVVSLSIYGSRSEVNGSASENQVVINCEYREGGIGFMNVTDLSLSGITMVYCGVQGAKSASLRDKLGFAYHALQMFERINVNLSYLFIINSTEVGLLCINVQGASSIQDSVFTLSNYRLLEKYMQVEVECSVDDWKCQGVNVWVFYSNPVFKITSNVSKFVVEKTKISYGVNLIPTDDSVSMSAGIAFHFNPGLEYDVRITIDKCNITNNIARYAAHLFVNILSHCSLLVKDSNFTYANRLTEGDPLELVPVVQPDMGTLILHILDYYNGNGSAIDVEIGIKQVHIAENVGGGLHTSFYPRLSQSYVQLKVLNVEVVRNYLIQTNLEFSGAVVQLNGHLKNAGGVYISLESVEISSNVFIYQDGNARNQEPLDVHISALAVRNTEVHFKQTTFSDNSMPAVYSYSGDLHFHGVNVLRNNTGGHCGGGLVLKLSHIYLHKGTHVYIIENTALKYGGGICVDGGSVPEMFDVCFWQVVDPDINNTFVYLDGNVAPITGYEIYAGSIDDCINLSTYEEQMTADEHSVLSHAIFTHVFVYIESSFYQVSSQPLTVCFCYQGSGLMCDDSVVQQSISVFPGQTFNVLAVGVGVGISPAVIRSKINGKYDIFPEFQSLGNACEPLNYTILAPENISGIIVQLTVEGSYYLHGYIKYLNLTTLNCPRGFILQQLKCGCHPMLQRASVQCDIHTQSFTRSGSVWIGLGSDEEGLLTHIHCPNAYCKLQETGDWTVEGSYLVSDYITTLNCPLGFVLQQLKCKCHLMLQRASVQCDINTQRFTRSGSVWIGMGSDEEGLLTHMYCTNAYCKLQETDLNLTSPDVQCTFGHSGVLCGSCKSGLALMLGSSKCQFCSNLYLLLLVPFLAAGVLLVIILGRLDLTVASGTINGILFYANVVKASSDALISNSVSKYFMVLSAWLNLDLGIETCFYSHLDMFWKVLLQFAFPLYIWLLVAGIILLSRYSTVAARLSGSNSVTVLATLFFLSYAKILATIIVAFSFTSLEAEKISPLVWLHDGNLRFLLHGKAHSLGPGVHSVCAILHYPSYPTPAVCSSLAEGKSPQDSEAGSKVEASIGCLPGTLQGQVSLVARTDADDKNHPFYCTNHQHKARPKTECSICVCDCPSFGSLFISWSVQEQATEPS